MPLRVRCHCGQKLTVPEQRAGMKVACPVCNAEVTIPPSRPESAAERAADSSPQPGGQKQNDKKQQKKKEPPVPPSPIERQTQPPGKQEDALESPAKAAPQAQTEKREAATSNREAKEPVQDEPASGQSKGRPLAPQPAALKRPQPREAIQARPPSPPPVPSTPPAAAGPPPRPPAKKKKEPAAVSKPEETAGPLAGGSPARPADGLSPAPPLPDRPTAAAVIIPPPAGDAGSAESLPASAVASSSSKPPPLPGTGSVVTKPIELAKAPADKVETSSSEGKTSETSAKAMDVAVGVQSSGSAAQENQLPGIEHDPGRIWTVYQLALAAAALGAASIYPAVIEIVRHVRQSFESAGIENWAWVVLLVGGIQLVYALYLAQLPDWSSTWVVMIVNALVAMLYAVGMGISLMAKEDNEIILDLGLSSVQQSGYLSPWCCMMTLLLSLLTYMLIRTSLRWRKSFDLAMGIR
jgi:hypothetical protein